MCYSFNQDRCNPSTNGLVCPSDPKLLLTSSKCGGNRPDTQCG